MADNNRTPSGSYRQNWPTYNAAQNNEARLFPILLRELCLEIEEKEGGMGRPPLPLQEMLFCIVSMIYAGSASRKFKYAMEEMRSKGFINSVPSPTSLLEYMRSQLLTPLLQHLLLKSSLPLASLEKVFAVDSTGLRAPRSSVWFNRHRGRREKKRDYVKLHVMCGVITNIITSAEVTVGPGSDRAYFKTLVERTARYFEITEVSADAGYLSPENMRAVILLQAIPYIAFYKTCTLDADFKSKPWKDALSLWQKRAPEFMNRYYMRNNVEATFSALKRELGDRLRSKSTSGMINETLCKVLCHNISVLILSTYKLGINPTSWSEATLTPVARAGMIGKALPYNTVKGVKGCILQEPAKFSSPSSDLRVKNNSYNQMSLFE